jgi:hypothetical protein
MMNGTEIGPIREWLKKWLETAKIWYNNRHSQQHLLPDDDEISLLVDFLKQLAEALGKAVSPYDIKLVVVCSHCLFLGKSSTSH